MEKPLKKFILEGVALLSVVLVNMILQILEQAGRLIKMAVNGTGNLEFYQVVVDGKATDMVLAVVDGKAKLIPEVAVNSIKDRKEGEMVVVRAYSTDYSSKAIYLYSGDFLSYATSISAVDGEKVGLKLGQEVYKEYKATDVDNITKFKEYVLPSGKRVDYIDFESKTVYELKAHNPNQIRRGNKQLQNYLNEIEEEFGDGWTSTLDTY